MTIPQSVRPARLRRLRTPVSLGAAAAMVATLAPLGGQAAADGSRVPFVNVGGSQKDAIGLAVDDEGRAHISFYERGAESDVWRYCRLPRSGTACDQATTFDLGSFPRSVGSDVRDPERNYYGSPSVLAEGDQITVIGEGLQLHGVSSDDNGDTFGDTTDFDGAAVGTSFQPEISAVGDGVGIVGDGSNTGGAHYYQTDQPGDQADLTDGSSTDAALGVLADGRPIVAYANFDNEIVYRRWSGAGNPNDEATWEDESLIVASGTIAVPTIAMGGSNSQAAQAGGTHLLVEIADSSVDSGLWLYSYDAAQDDWTKALRVTPPQDNDPIRADMIQDDAGQLHITWLNSNRDIDYRHVASGPAGLMAGPVVEIADTSRDSGVARVGARVGGPVWVAWHEGNKRVEARSINSIRLKPELNVGKINSRRRGKIARVPVSCPAATLAPCEGAVQLRVGRGFATGPQRIRLEPGEFRQIALKVRKNKQRAVRRGGRSAVLVARLVSIDAVPYILKKRTRIG